MKVVVALLDENLPAHNNRFKTLLPSVSQIEQAIINAPNDAQVIVVDVHLPL